MSDDKINQSGERNAAVGGNIYGGVHTGDKIIQPAPAGVAALRQIPSPPRDFTGREAEINELMQALENGGVAISGLQGQGGIGKTTLALELARRLKERYPDAHFFLDLKGVSPQPLSTADAMAHVIRAYHPTAKLPDSEAELRPIYNSALEGQLALLLMDNARDRAQVEPLIPPDGCLLIVTSRRHFTLPGMFDKNLDAMPPGDARKLLLKIAPRIGGLAETLAKLCGHLPLALRLAASALAERKDLKPADYARRLEDAKQRLQLIDASLGLSYDLLDAPMRERWRALAVFPDSFDVAGAAAVWRMENDAARHALSDLLNFSLLEWKEDKERYRLHDLSRVFANSRLGEGERASAALLHAKHYQNVSSDANAIFLKGGEAGLQALTRFDSEWGNIQSGQAWAAQHVGGNHEAGRLCVDYPLYCPDLLHIRLHPRETIGWLEASSNTARQLKDKLKESYSLNNLGLAYSDLGEVRKAIEYHEQSLVISREMGDRGGEGPSLNNLGNAYRDLGEVRKAIEYHEQSLVIKREIGDRRGEGASLNNLGLVYRDLGEVRKAIEYYEQSLVIDHEIGDRLGKGQSLNNLGNAYIDLGEVRKAIEYYEQSLVITREIGDRRGEAYALHGKAVAFDTLGDREQAIKLLEAALEIYEQIEDPWAKQARKTLAQWRGQ